MTEPDPYTPIPITIPDALLDASAFTDLAATAELGIGIDPMEVVRLRYAPFQAAYDAAKADWDRLMDASGLPHPMAGYAILNIHYPTIDTAHGRIGCASCGTAWPCGAFVALRDGYVDVYTNPAATAALVRADCAAQDFRDALDDLLHSPGVSAEQAREAGEALLKLAAGATSATVHIPAGVWPAPDEPFLQPDYIPAPVVGAPGEPIALMRREGGA